MNWWNRLKELLQPKLNHMFGENSALSCINHWFGCPNHCHLTNYLHKTHYPMARKMPGEKEEYYMICHDCNSHGVDVTKYGLKDTVSIQKDIQNSTFTFDRKADEMGCRKMIFSLSVGTFGASCLPMYSSESRIVLCVVETGTFMKYKWYGIWRNMDFTTACLMLQCPEIVCQEV